jgi:hypothetical protein
MQFSMEITNLILFWVKTCKGKAVMPKHEPVLA